MIPPQFARTRWARVLLPGKQEKEIRMLVLSRRRRESIVFPDIGVAIKLLGVDRNKARLGISAPPDVRVLREEVETGFDMGQPALAGEAASSAIGSIRCTL